jgi:hypothetical protein
MFTFDSVITSPFYTVAISMQLSVIPHLTLYGDVKQEELRKTYTRRLLESTGIKKPLLTPPETILPEVIQTRQRYIKELASN